MAFESLVQSYVIVFRDSYFAVVSSIGLYCSYVTFDAVSYMLHYLLIYYENCTKVHTKNKHTVKLIGTLVVWHGG